MSLIFTDGFEVEGTGVPNNYMKWSSSQANVTITTSQARTGSRSMTGASSHTVYKYLPISQFGATMIVGFAYMRTGTGTVVCAFGESTNTIHSQIAFNSDGSMSVSRAGTGTSAFSLPASTIELNKWYYIEYKVTIHDTTGSVEVKVDGSTRGSVSGVDTRNGGNGRIEFLSFQSFATNVYIDDLYLILVDGIQPTDYLGDVRIYSIFPSGAGTYTQFSPSTGANWSTVDDTGNPNTTDYVFGSGMYKIDSYAFTDFASSISGQVMAVMSNMYANRTGSYNITIGATTTLAGQTLVTSGQNINNAGYWYQFPLPITPASGSWSISDLNSAEFGFQIIGSGV